MRALNNQRGVAILMVLAMVSALSIAVVEFSYHEQINYDLAVRTEQRGQAYYLAQSAINISKGLLQIQKQAEADVRKANQDPSAFPPLYKQQGLDPLSTALLRDLFSGELMSAPAGEGSAGGEDETPADTTAPVVESEGDAEGDAEGDDAEGESDGGLSSINAAIGMIDKEAAQKFLSFEGDFLAFIKEEQTKINLNAVFGMETKSKEFDQHKKLIQSLLDQPELLKLFEDDPKKAEELVHAMADWVDNNNEVNDYDGVQRGSEDSQFDGGVKSKNGKFLSLSELRLLPKMTDVLFDKISPNLTVYSGMDKVNGCLAEEDMLKILIHHYTNHSGCTTPLRYDDEEKMTELSSAVKLACPDPDNMALALNQLLGLADITDSADDASANDQRRKPKTKQGTVIGDCLFQFKDLLTKENQVFRLEGFGSVGDPDAPTMVKVIQVIDTSDKNPGKWPTLYYRVE